MGKITVLIKNDLEKKMRLYIALHYPQETYGKLSEFVNRAIGYYLTHHK